MENNNKKYIALIVAIFILFLSALSNMVKPIKTEEEKETTILKDNFRAFLEEFNTNIISQGNIDEKILVIDISGVIGGSEMVLGFEKGAQATILKSLEKASQDDTIKGIILSVDSPGGTVYHSAEIYDKILWLKGKTDKPIYTSMGSVAASGGYYVAAPTDKIFASPDTITGSIGVISNFINYQGLEEKLGIKRNVFKSGEFKDIGSPSREMTEKEREINQAMVDEFYDRFVDIVSEGRGLSESKVRELADGRVYTGRQALKNGLVDKLGYFEDAVKDMALILNLDKPHVIKYTYNPLSFYNIGLQTDGVFGLLRKGISEEESLIRFLDKAYSENGLAKFYYMSGGY